MECAIEPNISVFGISPKKGYKQPKIGVFSSMYFIRNSFVFEIVVSCCDHKGTFIKQVVFVLKSYRSSQLMANYHK